MPMKITVSARTTAKRDSGAAERFDASETQSARMAADAAAGEPEIG